MMSDSVFGNHTRPQEIGVSG